MAVTFNLLSTAPDELVYTVASTAGAPDTGTLPYATLLADAPTGSPLKTALASVDGQCGAASNAGAIAALITGAGFTGTGTGTPALRTYIQSWVQATTAINTGVTAVDSGANDDPDLVVSTANSFTGYLRVSLRHSIIR